MWIYEGILYKESMGQCVYDVCVQKHIRGNIIYIYAYEIYHRYIYACGPDERAGYHKESLQLKFQGFSLFHFWKKKFKNSIFFNLFRDVFFYGKT